MKHHNCKITLTNKIILKKSEFFHWLLDNIRNYLTFDNPKFVEAKERGYWTGDMPEHIYAYSENENMLFANRGYLGNLIHYLTNLGFKCQVIDQRRKLPKIDFTFQGNLREYQQKAVSDALKKHFGILVSPCGSGKTVMALSIIAQRKQPTIIAVHTKELLNQWIDRIHQYLGIPHNEIGVIGSGKESIRPATVGLVQTLYRRDLQEISSHFGQLIVDECHRTPSMTFTEIATAFDSYYMLGLSATPYRRDRLNKLIFVTLGNISATITDKDLEAAKVRIRPEVIPRKTDFYYDYCEDSDYVPMISALTEDLSRNRLIVYDIASEYQDPDTFSIVLSDRKVHCEFLASLLKKKGVHCAVLTGDIAKKRREAIVKKLETGNLRVILATGSLLGEGFDAPKLNRLFIVTPVKWKGRIKQYTGRILRNADGKIDAKIFDYVDCKVGILENAFKSRVRNFYMSLN